MWTNIEVTVVDGNQALSCAAPIGSPCTSKSDSATRVMEHLLECVAARALHPDVRADVLGVPRSVGGTGAGGVFPFCSTGETLLPPFAPFMLNDSEQRRAMIMLEGRFPSSFLHTPEWLSFFFLISRGGFLEPGDPRTGGGALLDAESGEVTV